MLVTLKQRARAVLTSSRGDLTSQSIVGAIVVSLMSVGMVALFIALLSASQAAATSTSRSAILSAEAAAHAPQVHSLIEMDDAVRVEQPEASGGASTAWVWAQQVSELEAEIYAAMPRLTRTGDMVQECTVNTGQTDFAGKPLIEAAPGCLVKSLPITLDLAGVDGNIVVADGQDSYLDTTVPEDVDELRYVVLVTDVTGSDPAIAIVNTDREGTQREHLIEVTGPGYYYGGLDVENVSELHIEARGIDIDQDRSMIYEAPR